MRTERDLLGRVELAPDSLTGIHSARARENFGLVGGQLNGKILCAYGLVKLACARVNRDLGYLDDSTAAAIETACTELAEGKLDTPAPPAALQGGAGTSTNMYVNELLANRALQVLGKPCGSYDVISPLGHINLHQSTNDTFPTAVRVAGLLALEQLEEAVSELTTALQVKEKEFSEVVKIGRTQLQDAVLISLGREIGAYAEAFSRDRWRISKCSERLRVVNLGGTAIGTGLGAPRKFIFKITDELRRITALPLARGENLVAATQNADDIVEASGILKALGANLVKISSDLRLLASGPKSGIAEITLPAVQAGSSIMPGKVNPVIAEMAGQVGMMTAARDSAITMGAMNGQLELNAFMPMIGHNLLCMIEELTFAAWRLRTHCIEGLAANEEKCRESVQASTATITAFVSKIGYARASEIAQKALDENKSVRRILLEQGICSEEEFDRMTSAEAVLKLGF